MYSRLPVSQSAKETMCKSPPTIFVCNSGILVVHKLQTSFSDVETAEGCQMSGNKSLATCSGINRFFIWGGTVIAWGELIMLLELTSAKHKDLRLRLEVESRDQL